MGEPTVAYLTPPRGVRMSDQYFLNADLDHFWVLRRFQVVQQLADAYLKRAARVAEIGCGNGIVQRQVEIAYNRDADGFDLNEFALKHNLSERSGVYCYDVHDRLPELAGKYDFLLMLDVLEHIEDEDAFLESVLFMLAPGGSIILNVPAGQYLFSDYDRMQGHCRRYSLEMLRQVMERNKLSILAETYWGLPMVPLLMARRFNRSQNEQEVMQKGFLPPGPLANRMLKVLAKCERTPQTTAGTSVMMLVTRR
jgi:SAM-dependent methyltransferase